MNPRRYSSLAPPSTYEADILEGLEPFATDELRALAGPSLELAREQRPATLRFRYAGDPDRLLDLRSVVALSLVHAFPVPRPRGLLGHQYFTTLVQMLEQARSLWAADNFPVLRLNAAGAESAVMARLRDELASRLSMPATTSKEGEGDLLLRLRPDRAGGWEALVRLSPFPLATRPWRVCNMPGALNATVASVMMRLAAPRPSDRLLNIACGSGTLLIEGLMQTRVATATGCDTDPAALECAQANLRAARMEDLVRLESWDASQLPLDDNSLDLICADLPFGQLIGSHDRNQELYPRIVAEATRLARAGARMALITHEIRLLEQSLGNYSRQWEQGPSIRVRVGGMAPRIFLLRRRAG
ncbi:MAG TPA: methyltransferase domain-containing protein [Roseiflexaceae bacterium]|nr:methyltransferase domain-containing protein [Roseiflexaceae bacterium]